MSDIPQHLQAKFMAEVQTLQMEEALRAYNEVLDDCFNRCINKFHSKNLNDSEKTCMERCSEKFLKLSYRAGMRFTQHKLAEQQQNQG